MATPRTFSPPSDAPHPQYPAGRLLNIGCGRHFRPGWVNLDAQPVDPAITPHDVRRGIPFSDGSFDFVYHSHLLEHLSPQDGQRFLRECHRVLAPGGTIRVVVPDLEQIARLYLCALDRARQGQATWAHHYDWMMIELFDQSVRESSGGGHGAYLDRDHIPNLDFVLSRHGREAQDSIAGQQVRRAARSAEAARTGGTALPRAGFIGEGWRTLQRRLRRLLSPDAGMLLREAAVKRLLGPEYELLRLGRFRRSGEVHLWMYDGYSLCRALTDAGFIAPRPVSAAESRMDGWGELRLDTEADGRIRKPDSLYVEAVRGEAAGRNR